MVCMTDAARRGNVLVLNAGSSSLKFVLVDPGSGERPVSGVVERIGTEQATLHVARDGGAREERHLDQGDYDTAVAGILDAANRLPMDAAATLRRASGRARWGGVLRLGRDRR